MQVAIVIPTYNEQNRIAQTIKTVLSYIEKTEAGAKDTFTLVISNDGSTDDTVKVAKQVVDEFANGEKIKIVGDAVNHGKGYALRKGVAAVEADLYYIADADLSTPIEDLDLFIDTYRTGSMNAKSDNVCHAVIGSRTLDTSQVVSKPHRKLFGVLSNLMIRMILGLKFKDTQCGFKLFDAEAKELFLQCKNNRWGYDFEFLYLMKKHNLNVCEIPVRWAQAEDSKVKFWHYFETFRELLRVRKIHG